jgi:hypothetical protein
MSAGSLGGVDTLIKAAVERLWFHLSGTDRWRIRTLGMYAYGALAGGIGYREWIVACQLLEPHGGGSRATDLQLLRANAAFDGSYCVTYPQIWLANDKVGMLFTTGERTSGTGSNGPPFPAPAGRRAPDLQHRPS